VEAARPVHTELSQKISAGLTQVWKQKDQVSRQGGEGNERVREKSFVKYAMKRN